MTETVQAQTATKAPQKTSCLFARILGIVLGAVFIYAGLIKMFDPVQFARDIDNYHMVPWPIGVRLAFYLPWLELMTGLALVIVRPFRLGAVAILTALTGVFIVGSVAAKARGIDISCGCFGRVSRNWSFSTHLLLDLVILAALIFLLARQLKAETGS